MRFALPAWLTPLLLPCAAALTLVPARGIAAEITAPALHSLAAQASDDVSGYWPTDPVQCDLILDGKIAEGDAATLQREFQKIVGNWNSFSFFFCLRSPGGDVKEALRIAKFVRETQRPSIATVVEDSQTCASACALVFLAGNAPARVGAWPNRFLHPRGRLLYHSSRLDLSAFSNESLLAYLTQPGGDRRGLKGKIADLYRDGLHDMQSTIDTFKGSVFQRDHQGEPWVKQSLFLEMFSQDPSEWICIDTVNAVGRWNMQVFGYKPPKKLERKHLLNACHNAHSWRGDAFALVETLDDTGEALERPDPKTVINGRTKEWEAFHDRITLTYQGSLSQLKCVVEIKYWEAKTALDYDTELTIHFDQTEGSFTRPGPVAFYPGDTLLPELPVSLPRPATRRLSVPAFKRYANSVVSGCTYRRIADTSLESCEAACGEDASCQSYSFSATRKACELKHTRSAVRLDPLWVSGSPGDGPELERSQRAVTMVNDTDDRRIDGAIGETSSEETPEPCVARCESDRNCFGVEFDETKKTCTRYDRIDDHRPRRQDSEVSVSIWIKRQQ